MPKPSVSPLPRNPIFNGRTDAELRTQKKDLFPAPPCPAHKRTEIHFFLIQNWLVSMWTNRNFYCQYQSRCKRLPEPEKASKALFCFQAAQHRDRLQRKEVGWVSLTRFLERNFCRADWPLPPRLSEGAGLEIPNCQVSFSSQPLSLCAYW